MKNVDKLLVTLVFILAIGLVIPLIQRQNIQKQYDLYKHQTDSLFAVTQRAYETQLAEGSRSRDSLRAVNDDLVRNYLRLRENEQSLLKQLKAANREKYQTMSALEKQNEMIKRARE